MAKDDLVDMEGVIESGGKAGTFKVRLIDTDQLITAKLSGKIRQNKIRVTIGDRVTVSVSPFDLSVGRISFRHKE